MTRAKMFAIFFGLALGGGLAVTLVFANSWTTPWARALIVVHLLPVLLATLFVQGPVLKQPVLEPLGLQLKLGRWWLAGWVGPVVLLALGVLFAWLFFGVQPVLDAATYVTKKRALLAPDQLETFDRYVRESPPPNPLWFWLVAKGMPAGLSINLLVALAGELGFRGFLFREIRGGFWRRAFLSGVAEAAWLAPPVALGLHFPESPLVGVGLVVAWCLLASPVLTYLRARSGSVLVPALFRGTLMALTLPATEIAWDATAWQRPFFGVAGLAAMAVLILVCVVHDRFSAQRLAT
ncbi:MAG: CPBP family intramembrane metalloprotease [Sandaracinus sp.]|nr:CPBP family intramembrane metalloprotease [Sandaracinus sp.]MCB9621102.1 CPBP family intramembrane metalloprotease [Sandaracinus sp.]MCB9622573.1 CPBP family intramembrane metalloprotease [Sandaracinus sp.]MCB9636472.1 CPBP family intramembrane metalloprotease [Sandaracinus sp.]